VKWIDTLVSHYCCGIAFLWHVGRGEPNSDLFLSFLQQEGVDCDYYCDILLLFAGFHSVIFLLEMQGSLKSPDVVRGLQ